MPFSAISLAISARSGCVSRHRISCDRDSINTGLFPPCEFVAGAVNLTVMTAAKRDGELVADLTPQGPRLRKPKMMGVRRLSSADQARTPSDIFDVLAIPNSPRLRERKRPLVDPC